MALRKIFFCMFVICFMNLESTELEAEIGDPLGNQSLGKVVESESETSSGIDPSTITQSSNSLCGKECTARSPDGTDTDVTFEDLRQGSQVYWIFTLNNAELERQMYQLELPFDNDNLENAGYTYARYVKECIAGGSGGSDTEVTSVGLRHDRQVYWISALSDRDLEIQMYQLGLPFDNDNVENSRITYARYIKVYKDDDYWNRSPLKGVGEAPVCPEGEGTARYVLPNIYTIPMYCNGESRAYCKDPSLNFRQGTFFFVAYIQCKNKAYAVILNRNTFADNKNIVLDVVTLPRYPFPTRQHILESITPMMINAEKFIIYYRKEGGSCIRRTYTNIGYSTAYVIFRNYRNGEGETCLAFQKGISKYNEIESRLKGKRSVFSVQSDFQYICKRHVKEEPVDCSEKDRMKLVEYA